MYSPEYRDLVLKIRHSCHRANPIVWVCLALLWGSPATWAQTTDTISASAAPPSPSPLNANDPLPATPVSPPSAPKWNVLTEKQRESLSPLAATWDSLSEGHRRKWIALAKNYTSMAPAEREKLHSRMVEWSALSPKNRELARLNFVETKKISTPDRALDWEAYKALSPEERQKLASKAVQKPSGAAPAIKPAPPDKLIPVPVTRHSQAPQRELERAKQPIDRNTLLPIPPKSNQSGSRS